MNDLTPVQPARPLLWPEAVLDLQEHAQALQTPLYIVGGAVRDALLHRPIRDLDLATPDGAVRLGRRLADRLAGDVFVLDRERDVVRVLYTANDEGFTIDIARFRGPDLLADLRDRDFTINAMVVDLLADPGLLIDPLRGQDDIAAKLIRRCGPQSILTDPIRALRAVRQSVQFGMRIEAKTLEDVRRDGPRFVETSPERIRDELFAMLELERPAAALRVTETLGLLAPILPGLEALHEVSLPSPHVRDAWDGTLALIEKLAAVCTAIGPRRTDQTAAVFGLGMLVMQLDRYRARLQEHLGHAWPQGRSQRALLLFAALVHNFGLLAGEADEQVLHRARYTAELAEALRLSNGEKQRLVTAGQGAGHVLELADRSPLAAHRFWYRLGEAGVDACLLAAAGHISLQGPYLDQDLWLRMVEHLVWLLGAYYEHYDSIVMPPQPVDGTMLMRELSIKSGPQVGWLLDEIREACVTGDVQTADDALEYARRLLQENSD